MTINSERYKMDSHASSYCHYKNFILQLTKRLRWPRGSVLAFGIQVRGFKPGRSRRIFKGK